MTFDQFRASGRDVADIGAELRDVGLAGILGRIYHGGLYVEDGAATRPPRWRTLIGNRSIASDDLEAVERPLYGYAVAEGLA